MRYEVICLCSLAIKRGRTDKQTDRQTDKQFRESNSTEVENIFSQPSGYFPVSIGPRDNILEGVPASLYFLFTATEYRVRRLRVVLLNRSFMYIWLIEFSFLIINTTAVDETWVDENWVDENWVKKNVLNQGWLPKRTKTNKVKFRGSHRHLRGILTFREGVRRCPQSAGRWPLVACRCSAKYANATRWPVRLFLTASIWVAGLSGVFKKWDKQVMEDYPPVFCSLGKQIKIFTGLSVFSVSWCCC